MTDDAIHLDLIRIALDKVEGSRFELFFHNFYPAIAGETFIPAGGVGDGGADAFDSEPLYAGERTGGFYQASVQEDFRVKIRDTVKRLREFGRDPKRVTYVTSRSIKLIDIEEATLSAELGASVQIRDRAFLTAHINDSVSTRAAFECYLRPYLDFLRHVGGASSIVGPSRHVSSPAVYVFLRQELERRSGRDSLVNAMADGLILWALEGTDPDKGIFLTAPQVIAKVEVAIPATQKILRGVIPTRLAALSRSPSPERIVREHRRTKQYCLAYEVRKRLEDDNRDDEALRIAVLDRFETRLAEFESGALTLQQRAHAARSALAAVQRTFESEGLELAAFLSGASNDAHPAAVSDHLETCIGDDASIAAGDRALIRRAALATLRCAFYESTVEERLYFSRLSATFTLLFCLNTEPRVVEYFQRMASDFFLYVGSDILIQALSERYLRPEDQITRNSLALIREAGGTLVLAEPVLDEVHSHVAAADYEFQNKYSAIERFLTPEIARHSSRILIRAYFYARLLPPVGVKGPESWRGFLDQFCDIDALHRPGGREQLKKYLQAQFKMEFEDISSLKSMCDAGEIEALAQKFAAEKKDERLARNDALMALTVYARRGSRKETSRVSEFGYRTWWLTGERRILKHTAPLVTQHGARYMMRPEFIVSFLALSPTAAEVRKTFRQIFPSLLGIQLARRIDQKELFKVLLEVNKAQDYEEGRRHQIIADLSDRLKGDFGKEYAHLRPADEGLDE